MVSHMVKMPVRSSLDGQCQNPHTCSSRATCPSPTVRGSRQGSRILNLHLFQEKVCLSIYNLIYWACVCDGEPIARLRNVYV